MSQETGIPEVSADRAEVTVEVLSPFPRGACTVPWLLRDGLGETIASGLITFSVENEAAPPDGDGGDDDGDGDGDDVTADTEPATPSSTDAEADDDGTDGSSGGALWLGRVVSTTAVLALFGSLVLIGTAWPEGPEYVITARFLRSVWAIAVVGTLLFVVGFAADVSDQAFGASLSPGTWFELLDAGWAGRAALLRLVLVLVTGWVVLQPERVIDPTTQLPAFVIPALAVVAVGLSRTGGDLALVGVLLGIAHALAAAVWLGGALLVARVVVAGPGDDDLVHAVRGFNRISAPAIGLTVVTGVFQMFRLVGGALFTSSHGQVLLLKVVVVAAMVFVAMTARQMVSARLRRSEELSAASADRFRRAYSAEAGIGVVVLALSGWLLALSPAGIDDRETYPVERQFTDTTSGLDVIVSVRPAEAGLNGLRVEVEAPQEGVTNLVVEFVPPADRGARGIEQPIPLTGAGTSVLAVDDGIPLDVPGTWRILLSGVTEQGTVTDAETTFTVGGEASDDAVGTPVGDDQDETDDGSTGDGDGDGDDDTDAPVVTVELEPAG
ncbi:MAG: CopD family protein [Ilumatobacteraceae bacterium]